MLGTQDVGGLVARVAEAIKPKSARRSRASSAETKGGPRQKVQREEKEQETVKSQSDDN